MPMRRMTVIQLISPILTLKLVAMVTSLERVEKEGQIDNLQSNTYHMVKILVKFSKVDPAIICLKRLF